MGCELLVVLVDFLSLVDVVLQRRSAAEKWRETGKRAAGLGGEGKVGGGTEGRRREENT